MKARACNKLQPQSSSGRDCLPPSSQPRTGYTGSSRRSPYCASSTPPDRPSRSHTYTATQTNRHCTNQYNRKNRASMKTRSVLCQPADTLVHDASMRQSTPWSTSCDYSPRSSVSVTCSWDTALSWSQATDSSPSSPSPPQFHALNSTNTTAATDTTESPYH